MRLIIASLALSFPLYASDATQLVDVYPPVTKGAQTFTNTSDQTLRCMISTRVDESLPIGTLAEKRNITLSPFLSYRHQRVGYKIIKCEVLDASESE